VAVPGTHGAHPAEEHGAGGVGARERRGVAARYSSVRSASAPIRVWRGAAVR
jgi:hypothetical protein